jgi:hypothetical protein
MAVRIELGSQKEPVVVLHRPVGALISFPNMSWGIRDADVVAQRLCHPPHPSSPAGSAWSID